MENHDYQKTHGKNIMAVGLAAAETGSFLADENTGLFGFFDALQHTVATEAGERLSNIANRWLKLNEKVGGAITGFFGVNGLPLLISKALLKIHKSQIDQKPLSLTITQAFRWATAEHGIVTKADRAHPLIRQYRGNDDRLTPNSNFQEWYEVSRNKLESDYLERAFSFSMPPVTTLPGPHYFPFTVENQTRILDDLFTTYKSSLNSEVRSALGNSLSTWPAHMLGALRFALVDTPLERSFVERLNSAEEVLRDFYNRAAESELPAITIPITPYPIVVPLSQHEMVVAYNTLASSENRIARDLALSSMIATHLSLKGYTPREGLSWLADEVYTLADGFPFYLYKSGILSEANLERDVDEWFDGFFDDLHEEILDDKPYFSKDELKGVKQEMIAYYNEGKQYFRS